MACLETMQMSLTTAAAANSLDDASNSALLTATVYHLALLTDSKTLIPPAECIRGQPVPPPHPLPPPPHEHQRHPHSCTHHTSQPPVGFLL